MLKAEVPTRRKMDEDSNGIPLVRQWLAAEVSSSHGDHVLSSVGRQKCLFFFFQLYTSVEGRPVALADCLPLPWYKTSLGFAD